MKNGVTSTEFYVSILSTIMTAIAWSGLLTPENATQLTQTLIPVIMSVASAVHTFAYIFGRNTLKQKHIDLAITNASTNGNGSTVPHS